MVGLILYRKFKDSNAKYFIYFLIYAALVDFLGGYPSFMDKYEFLESIKSILEGTKFERNFWWSTIFWKVGSVLFFSFYFHRILKKVRFKKIIWFEGWLFFSFCLIYIILNWEQLFTSSFPIISILGAIIILSCAILYFIEILEGDRILKFYKSLNFYISSAILVWWLVRTPIIFFDIYFSREDWDFVILRYHLYLFSNIFMYLSFVIGMIWSRPENE